MNGYLIVIIQSLCFKKRKRFILRCLDSDNVYIHFGAGSSVVQSALGVKWVIGTVSLAFKGIMDRKVRFLGSLQGRIFPSIGQVN